MKTKQLMDNVVAQIPHDVMQVLAENVGACVLAGGFLRDTVANVAPKDIDLFFWDVDDMIAAAHDYAKRNSVLVNRIMTSPNVITVEQDLQIPRQFIYMNYNSPEDLLKSFDFTCCRLGAWFEKDNVLSHGMIALTDYLQATARTLIYVCDRDNVFPTKSALRAMQLTGRGYTIEREELIKLLYESHEELVRAVVAYPGLTDYERLEKLVHAYYEDTVMLCEIYATVDFLALSDDFLKSAIHYYAN